jgi:hypothetical protein
MSHNQYSNDDLVEQDLQSQTGRSQQYTDEEVLRHLRECADRNDGKCTVSLLSEEGDLVSPTVAVERFGTWSDAKEKAGLRDARLDDSQPREYTEEDYVKLIRDCEREYGKATERLFRDDEELLDALRTCKNKHGSVSVSTFAADDDLPSPETLQRRFGSWNEAKKKAGVGRYADG